MSNANPQHTKATWSSIFKRKGGSGRHTKLFEEFDAIDQKTITECVRLGEDELPVVASIPPGQNNWFLLTTKRLLLITDGLCEPVEITSIVGILPPRFDQVRKEQMSWLTLTTNGEHELQVQVEAGQPFYGIWNVLRNAVVQNKASN